MGRMKRSCGKCTEGWVVIPDGGQGTAIRCACRRDGESSHEYQQIMGALNYPARYLSGFRAPSRWPVPDGGGSITAWQGDPWSVYLWGPRGVGKSMLAVELAWRWIQSRRERGASWDGSAFATCREVVDAVYSGRGAQYSRPDRPGVLVLDDLGRGLAPGQWPAAVQVLEERWSRELPTVVTSQLSPQTEGDGSLGAVCADAGPLVSRLRDGWLVPVGGQDMRGRQK